MRFFTPDLYIRFNSPDEETADRADEEWEVAVRAYRKHLKGLAGHLPPAAEKLANRPFHDAELLGLRPDIGPPDSSFPGPSAAVALEQEGEIITLLYFLREPVRTHPGVGGWRFSKEDVHWLYDELDVSPRAPFFLHRILFSDGRVVEIPFWGLACLTFLSPSSCRAGQVA
jgi:hypothetical protein